MAPAIARLVQWVVSPGGAPRVRSINWAMTGALPGLRVLSRNSPSTPASIKRRCQRHTQGLDTPARRMILAVPQPPAMARTICVGTVAIGNDCLQSLPIPRPEPDLDILPHPWNARV